jgi:hypothetical protein
LDGWRR